LDEPGLPPGEYSIVCLPLLATGNPIGAIALIGSSSNDPGPHAGRILGILAGQIATSLVHSNLYAKLAMAQKVQTIVETAVTVNHQINNPLSVVLSSVGMLRRQMAVGENDEVESRLANIERAVSDVQEATQKLASIISPVVEEYANGIRMIDLAKSDSSPPVSRDEFLKKYAALLEQMRQDAEERSGYEPARTESIAHIGAILGQKIGLSEVELKDLRMLCLWHDIGIEGIDEKILRKPAPLDNEEMKNIQVHPMISERLLRPVHGPDGFVKLVRHHHEDVNGEGYPDKLSGSKLPHAVRIHRVVEAYVAMRSDRPFRPAMGPSEARNELIRCSGLQFDPAVVEEFLDLLRERPGLEEVCAHQLRRPE
ncbi:MAG: HD domain-containing protein, partial [Candidatus Coatesbacteria bacterium]|nr:HD domain-containing protein [Candidatus Coatesbacteria bacterium]